MNVTIAALLSATLLLTLNEQLALDYPTADAAQADSTRINAESHYASTPGDYHIAVWMRDEFAKAGLQASIETFNHDVPFSRFVGIEQFRGNGKWTKLTIGEEPIPEDPDGTRKDAGPPFNAWSGNGTPVQNVVDAGHGLDADYAALLAKHIDIRTRIALVRYGREFRGALAKRAQAHGAAGVIFFSDPADNDGSMNGPAYPAGPYRPLGSVQRGSLGVGEVHIPTLPVNALVAQRILATMRNGMTTMPYRLTVEMDVKHNARLWNTIGVIPGSDPTHMIVIGGHRDAWVYGVTDNGSGISIVLQAARALGYLYKSGWRPQYSIVFVGFDGEEIGEVGSNAYVQMHRGTLQAGCIAYINEDEATTGQFFGAEAAGAIADTVLPAAETIRDPASPTQTLYQRWRAQPGGTTVRGPGGGSDFEPFLYELGVPVMQLGMFGVFGVYHSGFDDLNYVVTQADPGFVNHRALAQMVTLLAMQFSNGSVPYHLLPYAATLRRDAQAIAGTYARDFDPLDKAIERYAYRAALADRKGIDGNVEIDAVQRLDKLVYGRDGYAAVPLPLVSVAIARGDEATVSAAVGRAAHDLDDITTAITNATLR